MLTNTYNQQKLSAKFYKNGYWSLTGQLTAIRGFFFVILIKWVPPLLLMHIYSTIVYLIKDIVSDGQLILAKGNPIKAS